ncbi:MAG: hypothetical protein J6U90_02240, partial [Methanobrevibacter sp.]|nr:hypothetical protein [Methanobrevibacter sp.]
QYRLASTRRQPASSLPRSGHWAPNLGPKSLPLVLHVGEDFEFLFTINEELKNQLSEEMNYYVIGEITDDNTIEIVLSNGQIEKISSRGYQHLK